MLYIARVLTLALFPGLAFASGPTGDVIDLTNHFAGFLAIAIFVVAYALVMAEESIHLPKSKPVLIAAGLIWLIIAVSYQGTGQEQLAEAAVRHNLLEFAELMLFLLVAMTYINAMEERRLFEWLREKLIASGLGLRSLFWLTGILAFFISPIADNLTTALLMCAVVMAVGGNNPRFIGPACINIVVASNAGGAFSPFGDITTLMVWQKGVLNFTEFFTLFIPAAVNFLIPATIMSFVLPSERPEASGQSVELKRGTWRIVWFFLATIATAVCFHNFLHLPPVIGMMLGLGYLNMFGYYLVKTLPKSLDKKRRIYEQRGDIEAIQRLGEVVPFNVFSKVARAEWDTLLFFYGVVLCVGGLGFMGYLSHASQLLYGDFGPTIANITVGVLSAIVDNIPVMFAVLAMMPEMSHGQWLLVTLTAGVGGSLLSIGSAAGVALMGQAKGKYTFLGHLKWSWAIALGYAASIVVHMWINDDLFHLTVETARVASGH
ncbi:MAG: sodium:proton antiporter NhaD [Litorivicinaceae bacterium]|jgi:NhaD family Na+/H+ antiporter|nr:sodium:proton antiporter NhaD [Litorivicinus sp.]MDA8581020.1 sodium:proton antiporter NhaD [Litorivicinaceae bacterium]MDA8665301.1 sodium:proton antiporter NhaD [Litorivicinaceae bacterium]MDB2402565.1 sodium:proton antiporter NhaD [Litorivicinaceae bacterium]MDF1782677.1 sodium:proton antiporter NhaD [Litorivicinaceae bacterium]